MTPTTAAQLYVPESARDEILRRALPQQGGIRGLTDPATGEQYAVLAKSDPLIQHILKSRRTPTARGAAGIPQRVSPALWRLGFYQGIKEPTTATSVTFDVLRRMARTPIVSAIIETRCDQGANFWRPPRFDGDTGFEIRLRDTKARMTPRAQRKAEEITALLRKGGVITKHPLTDEPAAWDGTYETRALSFVKLNQALWRDSLVFDGAALRIEPGLNEKRFPVAFMNPEDAATIRRAVPKPAKQALQLNTYEGKVDPYKPLLRGGDPGITFVQLDPNTQKPAREFRWNELEYWVRNMRTDIWVQGYGYSELERCIEAITGLLGAMSFNVEFFTTNHVPPGILSLVGDYNEEWLEEFRYMLTQNVGGPGKWHVLPMLLGDENAKSEFIRLRENEKLDMHWDRWTMFLINLLHSIYRVNAEETGWQSFSQKTSALQEADPKTRIIAGEDKGLKPLLRDSEDFWDRLVERIDPDFTFVYVGVDTEDEQRRDQAAVQRIQNGISHPWEERRKRDLPEIKDPIDIEKFEKIKALCREKKPDLEETDPEQFETWVQRQYEKNDGKWAIWPQAPLAPAQNQIWMQEHAAHFQEIQQEAQPEDQMGMGGMAGMFGGAGQPPGQMQQWQGQQQGDEQQQGGAQPQRGEQGGEEQEEQPDYMRHSVANAGQGHAAPPGYKPFEKALGGQQPRVIEVVVKRVDPGQHEEAPA